jgi:hypothetical protein
MDPGYVIWDVKKWFNTSLMPVTGINTGVPFLAVFAQRLITQILKEFSCLLCLRGKNLREKLLRAFVPACSADRPSWLKPPGKITSCLCAFVAKTSGQNYFVPLCLPVRQTGLSGKNLPVKLLRAFVPACSADRP